ncbi:spermidine synthase [Paraglaciecola sp. 2405UD69-4]|uniref:spermidine synthase n=1 Tax=Paraglaciecola sp. 2405UD69-4 TaxID=3391836 RepID=UPI0039C9F715
MPKYLFIIPLCISAFLLFQIQPILAKVLLPLFGGGAAIWTACMMFFQGMLLLGYLHGYLVTLIPKLRWQWLLQGLLLTLSLLGLNWTISTEGVDLNSPWPQLTILWVLVKQIGLPFYLLCSTNILLQYWYLKFYHSSSSSYSLYAWSNLGSLTALIAYPLFIESYLAVSIQNLFWSALYCLGVVSQMTLFFLLAKKQKCQKKQLHLNTLKITIPARLLCLWISLAATGSMILISTTQMLSLNISPMPFLWILPLGFYLLSYILVFSNINYYQRSYWFPLFGVCLFAALLMFYLGNQFNSFAQIVMYLLIQFVTCIVCHGELRKLAPEGHKMPLFYLCTAAGGLLGSVFVSILAPLIFKRLDEYLLALFLLFALTSLCITQKRKAYMVFYCLGLCLLPISYLLINSAYSRFDVAQVRNFYGYLSIKDVQTDQGMSRTMVDGTTVHGRQMLHSNVSQATDYYANNTGVSIAIAHAKLNPQMHMAVIGLGAGVLAQQGRKNDHITFYELNPAVKHFAQSYFSYLDNTQATIEVVMGDGRISLQESLELNQRNTLDILVIDAFSSDAIPTHLLTKEAFELYWQHLKPNGLLVIHTSNNHLDLKPVVYALGNNQNKHSLVFNNSNNQGSKYISEWVVVTSDKTFRSAPAVLIHSKQLQYSKQQAISWTDDFNSLMSVLKS